MNNITKPKISIVTVVYNGGIYLEKTIQSIIYQTYKNIEYIIIDGASTDNTIDIIKNYEDMISIWKSEKDNGIYDAMNKAIDIATGDFIWFINAGDEIYDNKTIENIFKNYNDEDVLYAPMQLINEDGSNASISTVPKSLTYKNFMHGMVVSHQAIIIKRKIIDYYNLDYKIVSDHDWVISALQKSKNIKNVNFLVSKYLLGGLSDKSFHQAWKEKFIIVGKYYGFFAYLLNLIYYSRAVMKRFIKNIYLEVNK